MNLEVMVNDYLLAWYILYGASLSKEIDRFKRNLFTKYKKEYNFCYKDRAEILKYGKDFIPDNDILYNAVLTSGLFKSLKKETVKHRNNIEKMWEGNRETINGHINNVIRLAFPKTVSAYVIHPRFEITEYSSDLKCIVLGKESLITLLMCVLITSPLPSHIFSILLRCFTVSFFNDLNNPLVKTAL